jgi:hypothetical protein
MKKITTTIALLFVMVVSVFAEHVEVSNARKAARTFLRCNNVKSTGLRDVSAEAGYANLYVFTTEHSFVIISADDCVQPILGYSLTGGFDFENMPDNKRAWIEGYNDEIQFAIAHQTRASTEVVQQWRNLIEGNPIIDRATTVVAPLLQTQWGQGSPYNMLCPGGSVAGCVATAMAQIMKYWNYPAHGIGWHSYTPYSHPEYGEQLADFQSTTYDWANMTNTYNYSSTETQKLAVATLMYHCGVSVNMDYSPSASSAGSAAGALKEYFNYSSETEYHYRSEYTDNVWINMLKADLNLNRPIWYRGSSSGGGHAFVFDGYNSSSYFHVNWGWGGYCDEYYTINNLNPNNVYNDDQAAIFGIHPSECTANAPTNLNYSQNGRNVTLSWSAAIGASSYQVYRDNFFLGSVSSTTYSDIVPYGTSVYYVRSMDSQGRLSLSSNAVTITVNYSTPVVNNLAATVMGNNVNLTWTAPDWCYPATPTATMTYGEGNYNGSYGYSGSANMYWGHRYIASSLNNYNNMKVYKVSFYANETGSYKVYVYKGTTSNHPQTLVLQQSVSVGTIGWFDIDISTPIQIDASQDLWVFIYDPEYRNYPATYSSYSGSEGNYYSTNPVSWVNNGGNFAFNIRTFVSDGTYTYNIYRNNSCIANNVSGTSYSDNNLATGLYNYYVKTNYYAGESNASNQVSVQIGSSNYTISASANPSSGGSVSGAGTYQNGSTCTLIATPATGYSFVRWTKNGSQVSTNPTYSFTVTQNASYVAVFSLNSYTISASANPSAVGTVSGGGTYNYGNTCTLTATPNAGYSFTNWTENGVLVSTEAAFSFIVTRNRSLVANFVETGSGCSITFNLNDSYGDGWNGNYLVVSYGDISVQLTIENGSTASYNLVIPDGSHVELTWISGSWIGECSYTISYENGNVIYYGSNMSNSFLWGFDIDCVGMPMTTFEISTSSIPSQGGTVSGAGVYTIGTTCNLTATPAIGYNFVRWMKNGNQVSTNTTYNFTVTENANYVAVFSPNSYTISATVNPEESGIITVVGEYLYGFDDSTLQGWTTIDADGDGYTWVSSMNPGVYHNNGVDLTGTGHNASAAYVISASWANGLSQALYPDNYLVSPQVNLGGTISFWACAQDANYVAEHFGVAVSTTDNTNASNFTTIQEWTMTAKGSGVPTRATRSDTRTQGTWYQFTVDLSAFAGQTGYVAIRHFNCTDQFILNVDDIIIREDVVSCGTNCNIFKYGQTCILTAMPNIDFIFTNWTEDGEVVSTDATYSFIVSGNRSLVANFSDGSLFIQFADPNVKALCVTNWDANGDGELSYAEAAAVTDLGTVFKGQSSITSFDELQYFTGLNSIGYQAFYNCSGLTSIVIPNSVTSIGNSAFYYCTSLISIEIPNSVTSIGNSAFYYCTSLTLIAIPNLVTSIGNYAFSSCIGLTSIVIPNSVTSIGNYAFQHCSFTSIEIPNSVTWIGTNPFSGCSGLEQIAVVSGNSFYDSRENSNAIIQTNTNMLVTGCKNTVIPNSVTSIGSYAFYYCTNLSSVVIPNTVTSIGSCAFYNCTSLSSVVIPNTVTSIGSYAFYYCTNLSSLVIPNSVTLIGNSAFSNCNGLASMIVLSDNPPTLGGNNVFYGINKSIPVYVPCASMPTYQYVMGWNEFSNYLPATTCTSGEITITANPIEGGTVTGAGYYDGGAICTLTATANPGYAFINWTKDGVEVSNSATYSFIVSGDASFVANFEQGVVVIGSGTSTNEFLPSYSYYCYTLSQQIYTANEIGGGGSISGIAFYNAGATKTRSYDIYMVYTDKLTFESNTDWIAVTEADRVFSGDVVMTANAWTDLQLNTPFLYNGVSNIALVVDDNTGSWTSSPNMACRVFEANGNQAIRVFSDDSNYDPYNPSGYTGTRYAVKNQIKLQIEIPCDITFELYDSYGDGYTGNYLVVSYGNVTEQLTVESGSYASHTLQIPDGSHVELSWISGSWISDCSFTISYANGNVLYYGHNLSSGYSYGFDVDCVEMPAISYGINAMANPTAGGSVSIDGGLGYGFGFEDGIVPISWSTSSDYPWQVVSSQYSYSGNYLCSSNSGVHSSNSSISTTVVYPADGNIRFHAICMGEGTYTYWDHCDFYIDGIRQLYAGANIIGWNHYSFPVSAGEHTFTWSYSKDSSVHPTGDFFGIDNVIFAFNSFNYGSTCTLTATPNPGYVFDNWTKNGTVVSTNPTYNFMVSESAAYVANFSLRVFHFITEGNWSISSNWQEGTLPETFNEVFIDAPCQLDQNAIVANLTVTEGQSLTLQPGKKLTVTNTLNNSATTGLIIEDGAQLIHASENVSAMVKKTIPGHGTDDGKYRLISNPLVTIVNPEQASLYHLTRGNYDLYGWLSSTPDSLEWRNYKKNDFMMLPDGYGYLYANQDGMELNFPGILRSSLYRFGKSVSYDPVNTEHPGWNLIGNPFVCEAYLVNENNEPLPFYRMNDAGNDFEAVSSGAIAPMEGVFYQASENGTVYFIRTDNTSQIPNYTISVSANPTDGGTAAGGGAYEENQSCTVSATANSSYTFTNWTENGMVVSTNSTYTFIVSGNRILVANFTYTGGTPPTGAINGKFTINANGDKVYFSQGNLQYQASTNTWRFAENQYDYVGSDNSNISQTYSGWIDLFGWGTSGYHDSSDPYNVNYQPWSTSYDSISAAYNYYGYGPSTNMPSPNLTGSSANYDWGIYNAISNGGNQAGQWRTLTGRGSGEWYYIFNTRSASTVNGVANARYAKAKVNSVQGVILFPDEYTHPGGVVQPVGINETGNAGWTGNNYTANDFGLMEQQGAVFLPAAGYRGATSVYSVGSSGDYWSASYCNSHCAYYVDFAGSNLVTNYYIMHHYGHSVRLVCPAEN